MVLEILVPFQFFFNKTRPEDALLGGNRTLIRSLEYELRSHSCGSESQATLFINNNLIVKLTMK